MGYPTITYDPGGSNTAASGAGPSTALMGAAASVTNGSGSVSITDAVNLSGVATDGTAAIWINTAAGSRHLSQITAISGSSGAWTVTVADTVWTTGSALSWAIGGKRAGLENDSTRCDWADFEPGWAAQFNTGTYNIAQSISPPAGSASANITFKNASGQTPTINTTANVATFNCNGLLAVYGITATTTAATKTSTKFMSGSGATAMGVSINSCVASGLQSFINSGFNNLSMSIRDCDISTLSDAIVAASGNSQQILIEDNYIHDCGGWGLNLANPYTGYLYCIERNLIVRCTSGGASLDVSTLATSYPTMPLVIGENVFDKNGGPGLKIIISTNPTKDIYITSNAFTGNGTYGLVVTGSAPTVCDYNAFGGTGRANTSGDRSGVSAGSHDVTFTASPYVDPDNASAANRNYALVTGSPAIGAGFPQTLRGTLTSCKTSIGVVQGYTGSGGSGGIKRVNFDGGF